MIVADTNVWSEPMRRNPDRAAIAWMRQHADELALTTVTIGELLYGLEIMPTGRRRDALVADVERLVEGSATRTFAYDHPSARQFAAIKAMRRRAGREVTKPEDAMIAAIAAAHGCAVAARNVDDFTDMGVEVINPWKDGR